MTKTKHEGIYFKVNAAGYKIYIARWYANGKDNQKVIGREPQINLAMAVKKRIEIVEQDKNPIFIEPTLSSAFESYIQTYESIRNPEWAYNYRMSFKKNCITIADNKPSQITTNQIQAICIQMIGKGLKPKTAKTVKDMLQAFYKHYCMTTGTTHSPAMNVKIPSVYNERDLCLTLEQIRDLVKAIKEYPDDDMRLFFMFVLHGRRRLETLKLQMSDFDFVNMKYTIKAENSKTRRQYEYPITDMLFDEIKDLSEFPTISTTKVEWHFKQLKKRAGIQNTDFRTHDFRHIVGTIGVNNGLSLEQIGKALGHNSINTTRRYSNVRLKQANTVITSVLSTIS